MAHSELAVMPGSSPTSPESFLERGPSLDDDTIRPGKSMKRPAYAADLSVCIQRPQAVEMEEVLTNTSFASSIYAKYDGEDTPLTPPMLNSLQPGIDAYELGYKHYMCDDRPTEYTDDSNTASHIYSYDLANDSAQKRHIFRQPSLNRVVSQKSTQSLRLSPSHSSLVDGTRPLGPRRVASSASLTGLDSEVDLFGFHSTEHQNLSTPALTSGSSSSSSRPSSLSHNKVATSDWYRHSSAASSRSFFAGDNSVDAQRPSPERVDVEVLESPCQTDNHSPNISYFAEKQSQKVDHLSPYSQHSAHHNDDGNSSPLTPSKVGLGITTADEESTLQQTPSNTPYKTGTSRHNTPSPSFASVSGRQRITGNSRSRALSVAERIERARRQSGTLLSTRNSVADDGHVTGLQTLPGPDATSWSMRGSRPKLSVLAALCDAPALNLTSLNIADCDLSELPISLTSFISLQKLNISDNHLSSKTLPSFLSALSSLLVFVADNCNIHYLNYPLISWSKLRTLSIKDNGLRSLPSWISRLEALEKLEVGGNPFVGQWVELVKPLLSQDGLASLQHANQSRASLAESFASEAESTPSPIDPSMFKQKSRPSIKKNSSITSAKSQSIASPISAAYSQATSRSETPNSFSPSSGTSLSFLSRVPSRDGLRDSQFNANPNLKKMKSVGDLRSKPDHTRARCSSVTPEAISPVSMQLSLPLLTTAKSGKTASFLRKMGSFGRNRKDTELGSKRPSLLQDGDRSSSAPNTATLGSTNSSPHERTISAGGALNGLPSFTEQPQDAALPRRVSRLALSAVPQPPLAGHVLAVDETSDAEEEEEEQIPEPVSHSSALRSLTAYLRDLDDLSVPRHAASSRTPPSTALNRQMLSRNSSIASRKLGRSNTSTSIDTDSENSRVPHSSTSTGMTSVSSFSSRFRVGTKNDADKRERVINEILTTERSYVKSLQELCDIYIHPLSKSAAARESAIPAAERKAVFANVEGLLQFHRDVFLPDLERVSTELFRQRGSAASDDSTQSMLLRHTAEDIAVVFNRHGQFLKMYSTYVNNFDNASKRLQAWSQPLTSSLMPHTPELSTVQRRRLKSFMKQCQSDTRHSQMNIESYLLMPVQRIPRYKMLLESMMSCTPADEESGAPNARIYTALELVTHLAFDLNERKRESEGRQRLLHWQARIGNRFRSPLVQPHRLLLKESKMILSRVVKRSEEYITVKDEPNTAQVPTLKVEVQQKPLIGLLTNDLLVLAHDSGRPSGPVDLFCVIRLGNIVQQECASVFGDGKSLRLVDPRSVMYFDMASSVEAAEWAGAINSQLTAF